MKPISSNINAIIKRIFDRHHPYFGVIITNWKKIVGTKYSSYCTPLSIRSIKEKGKKINILNVEVTNSALSVEISFLQDVIIERITVFLGFNAIQKLKITVNPS